MNELLSFIRPQECLSQPARDLKTEILPFVVEKYLYALRDRVNYIAKLFFHYGDKWECFHLISLNAPNNSIYEPEIFNAKTNNLALEPIIKEGISSPHYIFLYKGGFTLLAHKHNLEEGNSAITQELRKEIFFLFIPHVTATKVITANHSLELTQKYDSLDDDGLVAETFGDPSTCSIL